MPVAKKPRKSNLSRNQYTAELSSSQLVVGITILMVFGLACFLLGVLIGKFDPSLLPEQQVAQSDAPFSESASTRRVSASLESNAPAKNSRKSTTPVIEEKHIVVPSKPVTKAVKSATRVPESASISVTDLEPAERRKVTIPENTPQKALAKPNDSKIEPPVLQALASPGTQATPARPSKNVWAVQIAAFKDDTSAEVERKRLEAKLPFKIDILKRKGNKYNQLLIGHYATRPEADTFKQELIDKYNLVKPFLVNRN